MFALVQRMCFMYLKTVTARVILLTISSQVNNFSVKIYHVVLTIATTVPSYVFDTKLLEVSINTKLADPQFSQSKPIYLLIGARVLWCGWSNQTPRIIMQKTRLEF